MDENYNIFIDSTALVETGATIGPGSKIWHWSHVCSGAKIGKNVSIGQNVFVSSRAVIGDNCKIQNNVSIYDEVILEADVFCGPSVVFTNVHNPRAFIERKKEYRTTLIKKGATLGANSTIVCGISINEFAFVGAGAVITKDVKPFGLVIGNPGRQVGWISQFGERLDAPIKGKGEYTCEKTGAVYILDGENISIKSN